MRPGRPATADPTEADPSTYVPSKDHVEVSLKRTSKMCFGTAGCNVEVKVRMNIDKAAVPHTGTLTVYYKIKGSEDAVEGTLEADLEDMTYTQESEDLSTPRTGTKVGVKVTDIEYFEY